MDKIKGFKEKYDMPSGEELSHAFRTNIPRMADSRKKREHNFLGLNTKLQDLQSKVTILEETHNREKQNLDGKMEDLLARGAHSKELEADRSNMLQEVHQLETQRTNLRNKKPSAKDQQTVETGRKKFDYYKLLTGIRWDFGAPKETTKGYITNGNDHIHTFNYQDRECGSMLQNLLWKEISRGTGSSRINDFECKENRIPDD